MARKDRGEWEDHLAQVLLTKPAEVVQEACQVLEKHGWSVKELKSELYYSSTLCQVASMRWTVLYHKMQPYLHIRRLRESW